MFENCVHMLDDIVILLLLLLIINVAIILVVWRCLILNHSVPFFAGSINETNDFLSQSVTRLFMMVLVILLRKFIEVS